MAKKAKRDHPSVTPTAIYRFFITAYRIVVAFRKAPLQLAILQTKQIDVYGKEIPLISNVMTCWGTQFRALMSLSNNMRALQYYITDPGINMDTRIIKDLQDNAFWNNLSDLLWVLQLLHNAQKEFEASKTHIGLVAARWIRIQEELKALCLVTFNDDLQQFIHQDFPTRMDTQLTPLHWTAFYLILEKCNFYISVPNELQNIEVFDTYIIDKEEASAARNQFYAFRTCTGIFDLTPAWKEGKKLVIS